jgi:hypothetical protein
MDRHQVIKVVYSMSDTPKPTPSRHTAWVAGLVLGVALGFVGLEAPSIGLGLVVLAMVVLGLKAPRTAGIGGLAFGFGVLWVLVLARGLLYCSNGTWQGCSSSPTTEVFLAIGAIILLIGIVLSVVALTGRALRH